MKAFLGFIAGLLLLPLAPLGNAAPVTVPLSLSVTPPPVQVPVNQTITLLGTQYQVSGTLTLTPIAAATTGATTSGTTTGGTTTGSTTGATTGNTPGSTTSSTTGATTGATTGFTTGASLPGPGPMVTDTLTADRVSSDTYHLNDLVYLEGARFQNLPGSVYLNLLPMPVNAWSDTEIQISLANGPFLQGTMLTVMRPDKNYFSSNAFRVIP